MIQRITRTKSEVCFYIQFLEHHTDRLFADYVAKYANKDAAEEGGEDTESEDELSSVGSYESGGEEPAGTMDDV